MVWYCLSDETVNQGPVWWCHTPSMLKNQAELLIVSSCILALSPVTTNRLLGALLRWATGSGDKKTKIINHTMVWFLSFAWIHVFKKWKAWDLELGNIPEFSWQWKWHSFIVACLFRLRCNPVQSLPLAWFCWHNFQTLWFIRLKLNCFPLENCPSLKLYADLFSCYLCLICCSYEFVGPTCV